MARKIEFIEDAYNDIGEEVIVYGWVHQKRVVGKLVFLVIRDRSGEVQATFKDLPEAIMKRAESSSHEDVVSIRGEIKKRKGKEGQDEVEVIASNLNILSKTTKTPKFTPLTVHETNEPTRLKHRYMDLRSHEKQHMLKTRSNVIKTASDFLERRGFMSVHTPLLAKATPEGARDFLIPSRTFPGKFYALPQSPQIYKQLLMASNVERYYQVAPSFRDEDARADRHQEFYEIDLEASFVTGDEIRKLVTSLFKKLVTVVIPQKEVKNKVTWKTLRHSEAMKHYGSDKPDLRFDLRIEKTSDFFDTSTLDRLKVDHKNNRVIFFDKIKDVDNIRELASKTTLLALQVPFKNGFKILSYDKKTEKMSILTSNKDGEKRTTVKLMKSKLKKEVKNKVAFILNHSSKDAWKEDVILSQLRDFWGKSYLLNEDSPEFAFAWITHFPLLEKDKHTKELTPLHHPFTRPVKCIEEIKKLTTPAELLKLESTSFDIVCNGFELGSGSERIVDAKLQEKIFELINISKEEAKDKFGFLLEAYKYGVPQHAGIGIGLERTLMVLLHKSNIRDVIPFPKNADGFDHMSNSPSEVKIKK